MRQQWFVFDIHSIYIYGNTLRREILREPWFVFGLWLSTSWWRHQMETFSALLAFVRGIHRSPVNFPHKGQWRGALMLSLICNKRLSKQSRRWWLETPSRSLWRHCNDTWCFLSMAMILSSQIQNGSWLTPYFLALYKNSTFINPFGANLY